MQVIDKILIFAFKSKNTLSFWNLKTTSRDASESHLLPLLFIFLSNRMELIIYSGTVLMLAEIHFDDAYPLNLFHLCRLYSVIPFIYRNNRDL
jgi:hypothetical protein